MKINHELLQFFIYRRVIKKSQAAKILEDCQKTEMTVDEYMVIKEFCSPVKACEVLADFYCMPWVEIDMLDFDKTLLEKFSYEFLKKNKIVPICVDEKTGTMLVATGKPVDCNAMTALSAGFYSKVEYILVPAVQVDRYIDSIVAVLSTTEALSDLNSESDTKLFQEVKNQMQVVTFKEDDVINNPTVRLVDSIIKEAIPYRASDIHIEPFEKIVRVRYRIDGTLQTRADIPIESYPAICARLKIMAGMNIAERRVPQDGRINLMVGGKEFDFRVSSLPTVYGEKFVIRILDKTSFSLTRADLGFTKASNEVLDKILSKPHGIILLTGPTGSGKSTTLYSFLREINKPEVNVVTVEDPVEYTLNGINQTQINTKANMTFASALRSILRQDPDIIMIGEIRDEETAQIAIRAAITGHLVFSTLHTNDAPGAIVRLEDMGVADYLVADALVGVVAQRLVKRLCPACKKRGKTTPKEMEILGIDEPISIARPKGCQFCNQTGYKGRIAVHEIMYVSDEMKVVIAKERSVEKLRELAREHGMTPLFDSCRDLVLKGITSLQELMTLEVD